MIKKRILLAVAVLVLLFVPLNALAESDYEEGVGWIFQGGTLTVTDNGGLNDFASNDQNTPNREWKYQHSVSDVETLIIGKDVTELAYEVFDWDLIRPTNTIIEAGNSCFVIDHGWIVNMQSKALYGAVNVEKSLEATVIDDLPTYIEVIGAYALCERRDLVDVDIPSGVKEIQKGAFWLCKSIQTTHLPNGLVSIGDYAFCSCSSLSEIDLPAQLNTIGYMAFDGCVNMKSPNINETSIQGISRDCFGACFNIKTIELPKTAIKIEDRAFRICYALNTLIINSSKIEVEDLAFCSCDNLNRILFTKGTPLSFGKTLFGETGKTADGTSYISGSSDHRGEAIPYPTLYYTAAYAAEWSPNGETEWNGYPIQQISQDVLDAVIAQARGEAGQANTPVPTSAPAPTLAPVSAEASPAPSPLGGWLIAGIALAVIAAVVVVVGVVRGRRK